MARSSHLIPTAVGAVFVLATDNPVCALMRGSIVVLVVGSITLLQTLRSWTPRRRQRVDAQLERLDEKMQTLAADQLRIATLLSAIDQQTKANGAHTDALVRLERRRIHVERRMNGEAPTGPNPRVN